MLAERRRDPAEAAGAASRTRDARTVLRAIWAAEPFAARRSSAPYTLAHDAGRPGCACCSPPAPMIVRAPRGAPRNRIKRRPKTGAHRRPNFYSAVRSAMRVARDIGELARMLFYLTIAAARR